MWLCSARVGRRRQGRSRLLSERPMSAFVYRAAITATVFLGGTTYKLSRCLRCGAQQALGDRQRRGAHLSRCSGVCRSRVRGCRSRRKPAHRENVTLILPLHHELDVGAIVPPARCRSAHRRGIGPAYEQGRPPRDPAMDLSTQCSKTARSTVLAHLSAAPRAWHGEVWPAPEKIISPVAPKTVRGATVGGGNGTMCKWAVRDALCGRIGVVAGLSPAVAEGQDVYRQTVVVTASATPVELGSITRTLTVITRAQILELPVHTVADVLRLAASVDVRARGERGVQTDFAVRGATFGQMLVLVDGVRLNDAQSGHHNGDIPVPIDAVERIEILYGPGPRFRADASRHCNVITRLNANPLRRARGTHGFASGVRMRAFERRRVTECSRPRSIDLLLHVAEISTMTERSRTTFGERRGLDVVSLKELARQFLRRSAPPEWTNQMLVYADHVCVLPVEPPGKRLVRTHGDHSSSSNAARVVRYSTDHIRVHRHRDSRGMPCYCDLVSRAAPTGFGRAISAITALPRRGSGSATDPSNTQLTRHARGSLEEFGAGSPSIRAGGAVRTVRVARRPVALRVPTFTNVLFDPRIWAWVGWPGPHGRRRRGDVFLQSAVWSGGRSSHRDDAVSDWLRPSVPCGGRRTRSKWEYPRVALACGRRSPVALSSSRYRFSISMRRRRNSPIPARLAPRS